MNEKLIPCPFCKTPIPDDCIYCDMCGEKLRKCVSCGSFAKSKRCTNCGGQTEEISQDFTIVNKPKTIDSNKVERVSETSLKVEPGHLVCLSKDLRLGLSHDAVVGRRGSYGNAFQVFPSISGLHAKFIHKDGEWLIEDIGSSYGTFLNGKELDKHLAVIFRVGDVLKFADVEFKVTE